LSGDGKVPDESTRHLLSILVEVNEALLTRRLNTDATDGFVTAYAAISTQLFHGREYDSRQVVLWTQHGAYK
jgi:hypothetical protein